MRLFERITLEFIMLLAVTVFLAPVIADYFVR